MVVVDFLQQWEPVWLSVASFIVYALVVLLFFRFFGKLGLYVYMVVGVIGANIQVLKVSHFAVFNSPVALGTALFASTYLASDLLSEYYGKRAAQYGIAICFAALLFWTLLIFFMLGTAPLTAAQAGSHYNWALPTHPAMVTIFTPVPAIFIASLLAFCLSQLNDATLFQLLKQRTQGRWLFLRNNLSTWISALIDNAVFSITAFVLLAAEPVPLRELLMVYILGTYGLRVGYACLDTPFIYLAKQLRPAELRQAPAVPIAAAATANS